MIDHLLAGVTNVFEIRSKSHSFLVVSYMILKNVFSIIKSVSSMNSSSRKSVLKSR